MSLRFTIRAVSAKTGLSAHTIRAWERRYGALSPDRTESNRRLYEAEDIERLTLLKHAVDSGHSIGQLANLPVDQLRTLFTEERKSPPQSEPVSGEPNDFIGSCERAMEHLDADALENSLVQAAAHLGVSRLLEEVVLPFLGIIDRRWREGSLRIAHEHLASAVLRTCLERIRLSISARPSAARLLVTTPAGQYHEIGALIVAIVGAMQGWQVTYLGPNLPAEEIAAAAVQSGSHAVGLSIVYPADDPKLSAELLRLRELMGESMPLIVGGRAATAYSDALNAVGAESVTTLQALRSRLDALASQPRAKGA